MSRLLMLIPLLLGSSTVMAADDWTLTTSDLHSRTVQVRHLDSNGIIIDAVTSHSTLQTNPQPATQSTNELTTLSINDFLSLTRSNPTTALSARWSVQLQNGDVFTGEPESLEGETLHWRENLLGSITVPMSSVAVLRRSSRESAMAPAAKKPANLDDVVQLSNGDTLHGVVTDLNGKSVSVQRSDGSASPVPMDSVANIEFAATASAATSPSESAAPSFRITLADRSAISCDHLQIDLSTVTTTVDGTPKQLPLESVQSIEQLDGPVTWLWDRAPAEDIQIPMLGPMRPTRFDRSVTGEPLQFGERRFAHGIGVHAYSRLTWPIAAGFQGFRTQFAIDGNLPLADLTVRIRLDGAVVSEARDVRAGQLQPVIFLDVRGKHTVTLEVEDPSNDDVQARLNWLEPALLRDLPSDFTTIDADLSNKSGGR